MDKSSPNATHRHSQAAERYASSWVTISLLFLLTMLGCNRLEQPISSTSSVHPDGYSVSATTSSDESLEPYAQDNPFVQVDNIPPDLLTHLHQYIPNSEKARDDFVRKVATMRSESEWLDASLKAPLDSPLLTHEGKNPGPNTQSRLMDNMSLSDKLLQDYLQNSTEPDADKQELATLYKRNILDLLADRITDLDTQSKIFSKYETGNFDPFLLYLNLEYAQLYKANRDAISAKLVAALKSRKCSPETVICLVEQADVSSGILSAEDRIYITKTVLASVPEFLRGLSADDKHLYVAHLAIIEVQTKLPADGQLDLLRLILDLRKGEDGEAIVPDSLLHHYLCRFYWTIASTARGGQFMSEVADANIEVFEEFGELAANHAMVAFVSDAENPYVSKTLLVIELKSSGTPFSMPELYRIGMMTQCDSSFAIDKLCWSMMPRFGGSRDQVQRFASLLIDQTLGSSDNQICFDVAIERLLQDQGWFDNLANTTRLEEPLFRLHDRLIESNGGKPDRRLSQTQVALIVRFLWDAGDLTRLKQMVELYNAGMVNNAYYSRYVPIWLVNLVLKACLYPNAPQDAIMSLQQDLICGDENFNDERIARINRSLQSLEAFLATDKPSQSSVPATENSATSEENIKGEPSLDRNPVRQYLSMVHLLRDQLVRYRSEESVNLVGDSLPWTNYGHGSTVNYNAGSIDIKTKCQDSDLLMVYPLRFKQPFVVELDVAQGQCDADPYGIALFAGQVSRNSTDSHQSGRSLRYSPGYPMVMQDRLPAEYLRGPFYHEHRLLPVPANATLKMDVTGEGVRSYVNDVLITHATYPIETGGHIQIGRYAGDRFDGVPDKDAIYKITALRIRSQSQYHEKNDAATKP